jgi:hypothetical protein
MGLRDAYRVRLLARGHDWASPEPGILLIRGRGDAVVKARIEFASQMLAHVPDLVLSGSKPRREIARDPLAFDQIGSALRDTTDAARYLPRQDDQAGWKVIRSEASGA